MEGSKAREYNKKDSWLTEKDFWKGYNFWIVEEELQKFVKLFPDDYLYDDYIKLIHQIEKKNHLSIWDKIIEILDFIIKINMIKKKS